MKPEDRPDEIRPPTFDGPNDALWKRHPDVQWDSPAEDTALTFTTPAATGTRPSVPSAIGHQFIQNRTIARYAML